MSPSDRLLLQAITFDAPYLIQIMDHSGDVLVTVAARDHGTDPRHFSIWRGYGVDDQGIETSPLQNIVVDADQIDMIWSETVRVGYRLAFDILSERIG